MSARPTALRGARRIRTVEALTSALDRGRLVRGDTCLYRQHLTYPRHVYAERDGHQWVTSRDFALADMARALAEGMAVYSLP